MSLNKNGIRWINLNLALCFDNYFTVPTGINANNYIVIDSSNGKWNICKYNIGNDKWNKNKLVKDIKHQKTYDYTSILNTKTQILFVVSEHYITQIQLNNGNIITYTHNHTTNSISAISQSIIVNNSLFIVGGHDNNSILKWNPKNNSFVKFSDTYNKINFGDFTMIENNNNLLLFGGVDYTNDKCVDYILKFNINNKKWTKLCTLPKTMSSTCCTTAINKKYILLFGGWNEFEDFAYSDTIYIYSLKYNRIQESFIKCPSKGIFSVITINNKIKDEKIVFGYIRKKWKIKNNFMPFYLLKLIHSYYLNEYVLLLDKKTKKHYKMDTLKIVCSI